MKYFVKLFCIAVLLSACGQSGQNVQNANAQSAQDSLTISCQGIGLVKSDYSREDLNTHFAAEDLEDGERELDGKTHPVTFVYPQQDREVTVVWRDDQKQQVEKLLIWNENGPYATKEGLRVGISLRDVVKLNNFLSVNFTNFYSSIDGFARITGFNGGEIEEKYPCLSGQLDIVRLQGVDKFKLEEFKAQDTVSSSDALMQSMQVKITEISIQGQ